jgi:DNA-binding response OmpR family regulator
VARILIAEDDPRIGRLLEKALQKHGYSTFLADDGNKAHSLSLTDEFDLMILDMGLPQREGFQVLQDLRAHGKTLPVLVLTGRSERDIVMCLEAGADDYMRKPFQFDDLLERVRARLDNAATAEPNILKAGKVRIDLRARRTTVDGEPVDLSAREFALLETLLRNAGQVLSREQLQSKVWGYSFEASSNVVDLHVNSLSDKIGADVIETVRGAGYRLQTRS